MSFGVNSIAASQEDEQMIKDLQKAAVMRDPTMAAANIASAQSDAMRAAAANPNARWQALWAWAWQAAWAA